MTDRDTEREKEKKAEISSREANDYVNEFRLSRAQCSANIQIIKYQKYKPTRTINSNENYKNSCLQASFFPIAAW